MKSNAVASFSWAIVGYVSSTGATALDVSFEEFCCGLENCSFLCFPIVFPRWIVVFTKKVTSFFPKCHNVFDTTTPPVMNIEFPYRLISYSLRYWFPYAIDFLPHKYSLILATRSDIISCSSSFSSRNIHPFKCFILIAVFWSFYFFVVWWIQLTWTVLECFTLYGSWRYMTGGTHSLPHEDHHQNIRSDLEQQWPTHLFWFCNEPV